MIISRTPFRISFFGGGTDYPAWYRAHGGSVLATTIDKYCYLTCRYLPPFFEHTYRVVWSKIENSRTVDEIVHPVVRAALRYLKIDRGVEIHHDGDLPARSGVGSSSSFTVGLLHALYALRGQMPSKEQLARESMHVEQELLRETVGSQDQLLASYGGFNHVIFHPDGEITVRPMTLRSERIKELNDHLMLFYTGISRTAADVALSYVRDIESKQRELHSVREMVDEAVAILNGGHDLGPFGRLMHESWLVKRGLSDQVSTPEIEEMYQAARAAGALGGKLLGAGGGGFMLLFVRPSRQRAVRRALARLLHVPFTFEFLGSQIIFYDREQEYPLDRAGRPALARRATRASRPRPAVMSVPRLRAGGPALA
ncbi:MAG: kinase [Chloroflexi bacterium]|nr:kinase [Chloroflexota bacterium]